MTSTEKQTWIQGVLAVVTYVAYLVIIINRSGQSPLVDVAYVVPMLITIGVAIVAAIVINIVAGILSPDDAGKTDARDKEIHRAGEFIGQGFLVLGAVVVLAMAMFEMAHFWIANVIYLAFTLSAITAAVAKIFAYRGGFQSW